MTPLKQDATAKNKSNITSKRLAEAAKIIEAVAKDHNVCGQVLAAHAGPVITTYAFETENGTPATRVKALEHWWAKTLSVPFVQVSLKPDRENQFFLEVPNRSRRKVQLADLVEHPDFQKAGTGAMTFGVDAEGKPIIIRLHNLPHLLVAGNHAPEKARLIHSLFSSLLESSSESVRTLMIDPKMSDFYAYKDHPNLLAPVIADVEKAVMWLQWMEAEVEERLQHQTIRKTQGQIEVKEKENVLFGPPALLVIINELADLMVEAGAVVTTAINRIVNNGGAVGVHLIVATQCPSETLIPKALGGDGVARCAFQVASRSESIAILGSDGAEKLLGVGDGLLRLAGKEYIKRVYTPTP